MAERLELYNGALDLIGEEPLATLSDESKARRALDRQWDRVVRSLLESAQWKFAMVTVELTHDEDFEPQFGFQFVFSKPADWLRTYTVSSVPSLIPPLSRFVEESGLIYADVDPLYLKYVSSSIEAGWDLGRWTALFEDAVIATLAEKACPSITESETKLDRVTGQAAVARRLARSHDAFREGPKEWPDGKWVSSRRGSRGSRREY